MVILLSFRTVRQSYPVKKQTSKAKSWKRNLWSPKGKLVCLAFTNKPIWFALLWVSPDMQRIRIRSNRGRVFEARFADITHTKPSFHPGRKKPRRIVELRPHPSGKHPSGEGKIRKRRNKRNKVGNTTQDRGAVIRAFPNRGTIK
jgi:hypothetical protein